MSTSDVHRPRRLLALVAAWLAALLLASAARRADAGCNLIPQAQPAFRGALGTLDRPYAAPGDFVDVDVRQALCDQSSPGIAFTAANHEVTLVFTPPGGPRRVVVLTTAPCADLATRLDACQATSGVASGGVACRQVNQPGDPLGMAVVFVDGANHLRFRFPDTDALLPPDGDRRGYTGPVAIAVTEAGVALPCGLATGSCAAQATTLGLVACVDDLYDADGTCQPNPGDTFAQFTALPVANDFQADCYATSPPCTATAPEVRFALDRAGNLLFPVHWQGVLPTGSTRPIPRTLRVTVRPPVPIAIPDRAFLSSFTPEGQPLPPIFEPQADPTLAAEGVLNLFGTSDAPSTVLRIAQRRGRCVGGSADGAACAAAAECGAGASCIDACVGGANDGLVCSAKKDCPGGRCGALFDARDLAALATAGGPLVVPRLATDSPGVCQASPFPVCSVNADCGADPCVSYAFQAQDPVALESVASGSDQVLAFTALESIAALDRNGDGDQADLALTVRDRVTGEVQPLGRPSGTSADGLPDCGLAPSSDSRALVHVPLGTFTATALATEGDVVAFVESENGQGFCDENGDTDRNDGILRVFTVPGNERTAGVAPPRAVDPSLRVNGQSLAVSSGKVFFRSSEAAMATLGLARVSDGNGGVEGNGQTLDAQLSQDGRWVVFTSAADNLVAGDTNAAYDVFVRHRQSGAVTRVSLTSAGTQITAPSGAAAGSASISGDGRYVVFESFENGVVPGDTNVCFGGTPCADVFLHDRDTDADGVYDEPGFVGTTRVSLGPGGVQGDGHSRFPVISADGRVVVFQSRATNLVPGDGNGELDVFVRDLDTDTTERVSVAGNEEENLGVQTEDRVYDLSDDGRYVLFDLRTTNLPDGGEFSHDGPAIDVFLRDRVAGTTEQVTRHAGGQQVIFPSQFAYQPRMSGDARWVVFTNQPDFSGQTDIVIMDRVADTPPELVNVATATPAGPPYLSLHPDVSDDGRFVTFWSNGSALVTGYDGNGAYDLFVRDRTIGSLERLSVRADGNEGSGDLAARSASIGSDGREAVFVSAAINLLGPGLDGNGVPDAFLRGVDPADPNGIDALLFADGALDDVVLEVLDAASGTVTTLCPATDVAVANGAAVFLRPESALGTAACPGGPLNGDGDTSDAVVQYWPGTGPVQNLGVAGSAVALTAAHVAAIVPEAGQGAGSLNGDGDATDGVLQVRALGGGGWTNVGRAADLVRACGDVFAFRTPESAQGGGDLNGDGDAADGVLQLYVPATATLLNLGQAATDFQCNGRILAFRTSETEQGNTDLLVGFGPVGPNPTSVMQGWNLARPECLAPGPPADCLANSRRSAAVCDLEACDPRVPYKLVGGSVKFIAFECAQRGALLGGCASPGTDVNGDLDPDDLVLQVFHVATGAVNVVGSVAPETEDDPFLGGTTDDAEVGTVLVTPGRCVETLGAPCTTNDQCGGGELCVAGVCTREHRPCVTSADCPPGIVCTIAGVGTVAASPDTDGDGVADHLDNCVYAANAPQTDADADGAGDACDLATCGDGLRVYDEVCEAGDDALCPGDCVACRCAVCGTVVVDPKGKVQVNAKTGQLTASLSLPLGAYAGEPITVMLADADTPLVAREAVGVLPPVGKPPFKKWLRKTKLKTGVVQVQVKAAGPKQPGVFRVAVKAKRWFGAAAANQPAAATDLTLGVGTQCFRATATKKTD